MMQNRSTLALPWRLARVALVLALLVGLLAGCDDAVEPGELTSDDVTEADTQLADTQGGETDTDTAPEPAPTGRVPTRMTVEQLARSIPVITGGIEWIEDFGDGPINMLELLSPTLGAPDYLLVTEENLEPSLIIAKFMQDAAARVCVRWVAQDLQSPVGDRTLVTHEDWQSTHPPLVLENLRRLHLRFFSRYIPDDEGLAPLYTVFRSASEAAPTGFEAHDGWLAVCLAMMTDPQMLIY